MELHVQRSNGHSAQNQVCSVNGNWKVEDTSSCVSVHNLPRREQFLLLVNHPNTVYFKGRLCISVLMGSVDILGCTMSVRTNYRHTVYSPKGSSMQSIETCSASPPTSHDYEVMIEKLGEFGLELSNCILDEIRHRDCVILLEAPQPDCLEGYLNTLPSFKHLFTFTEMKERSTGGRESSPFYTAEEVLQCVFELPSTAKHLKRYRKGLDWVEISDKIIKDAVCTVVCGGKGVGKSTFLRFLVNRSLPVFGEVLCVDLDPGQPEFTIPGCVSAVIVKQPLLGPSFTHLTTPECMVFVGKVNISQCPVQYLDSVQHIISYCNSQPNLLKIPWIVNTMGFNKGLGVDLTTSVIRMLKPQHVVQIQSMNSEFNFPELLSPTYVCSYQSRLCKLPSDPLEYVLHTMKTMAGDKRAMSPWRLQPPSSGCKESKKCRLPRPSRWRLQDYQNIRQVTSQSDGRLRRPESASTALGMGAPRLREAVILSYLSQMVQPPKYLLADTVPYMTEFCKVTLCVCHARLPFSQILIAINGNLVGLCSYTGNNILVPDDPQLPSVVGQQPVCPCLGFGIVRGIDMQQKRLYIITPVPESVLSAVNCLMLGTIMLPSYVYCNASEHKGEIPYMATGPGHPLSEVSRRIFRPLQPICGTQK